ncbi:MAG: hypothetical protein WA941_18895 [Nitrososphaeraceae archaeon]
MLDSYSIPFIIIGIAALSFPYGYLAVSMFRKSINIIVPFFILFPLYLAVGISIMVLICITIPSLLVSPYVLVIGTIPGYVFTILTNKNILTSIKEGRHNLNIGDLKQFTIKFIGKCPKNSANIFSLCVIIFVFAFLGKVTADYSWPPVGDAILDSSLTALIVDREYIINEIPFSALPLAHPIGYHSVSANLSVLFTTYPAEAVFIFASFLLSLIACLLFSLTYILTRSSWISLPALSTIFIMPGSLEPSNWIGGYFFGGPYPIILGFMVIISLILQLQISVSHRYTKMSRTFPLTAIMLLSLLVIYPNFLVLGIIVVGLYYFFPLRKKIGFLSKGLKDISIVVVEYIKYGYHLTVGKVIIKEPGARTIKTAIPTNIEHRFISSSQNTFIVSPFTRGKDNLGNMLLSLLIVLIFAVPFILLDLGSYYYRIGPVFSTAYFENTGVGSDIFQSLVYAWSALSSDIYLASLLALQLGLAVIMMVIYSRTIPLFLTCIIFFASIFISSVSFISPWILVSLLGSLSFTVIAYSIRLILMKKGWINGRRNIAVIAGFVLVSMLCQISHIINQTYASDSNLILPDLDEFYAVGQWLDENVSQVDRVLNDRSFTGFYLDGFSRMNLSHTYLSDFLLIEPQANSQDYATELQMVEELNAVIWRNPNKPELVYPLLQYYNVSYIVLLPDSELIDLSALNVSEKYLKKPYSNREYIQYFDSYDFLMSNLSLAGGSSRIYSVR